MNPESRDGREVEASEIPTDMLDEGISIDSANQFVGTYQIIKHISNGYKADGAARRRTAAVDSCPDTSRP